MQYARRFRFGFVLLFTGVLGANPATADPSATYLQTLNQYLSLIERSFSITAMSDYQPGIELAHVTLQSLDETTLEQIFAESLTTAEFHQLYLAAATELQQAQNFALRNSPPAADVIEPGLGNDNAIVIPVIDVVPGFCANTTAPINFLALATSRAIKPVLKAAEFPCQQQVAGENSALACATMEVLSATAALEFELTQFCLSEKRAGRGRASLALEQNIGAHLNAFADVATSSIASQQALNDSQAVQTQLLQNLGIAQNTVDSQFASIDASLVAALNSLNQLADGLTELIARSGDINFRTQANQVEIEDLQVRAADLQQRTAEIRDDTQYLMTEAQTLNNLAGNLSTTINQRFNQVARDRIAAALADPDNIVLAYTIPATRGGQLEAVREVFINALIGADALGLKTTTARQLLQAGDAAYNEQRYVDAYRQFAQAYRTLLNTQF
ncbi:MAG: hypothetical protein Tsb002_34340 [Wenzhouxiangellaceae bacterium]